MARAKAKRRSPAARAKVANAIQARGLTRVFKGGVRAVDALDLEVHEGEIYGFLGPNGAGKSTTVHMLTTLLPPTEGTATVGGHDIVSDGAGVRRVIGAALQEVALDPNLTGREHIRMQGALHGMSRADCDARAEALLGRVGLTQAADRRTGAYSGGMKRRLDLALALVHNPRILFLDEPTTGLDVQSRTALWDEVRKLAHDDGVTILLTTQYLEEADVLADRVGIIHLGQIVAEGTPAALKAEIGRPLVEVVPARKADRAKISRTLAHFGEIEAGTRRDSVAVRLTSADGGLAPVVRALDRGKIRVSTLELHAPSLNDVFLNKTGTHLEGADEAGS